MTFGAAILLLSAAVVPLQALRTIHAPTEAFTSAADGNRLFTIELLQQLVPKRSNIFFSPFGISSAMALASLGARGNTLHEIDQVLHFDIVKGPDKDTIHHVYQHFIKMMTSNIQEANVSVASAFFGKSDIAVVPEFRLQAKRFYQSDFHFLSTNPEEQMNQWTAQHTNNMIRNIIPRASITPDVMMMLINAVHFKGKWVHHFNKEKTKMRDFYVGNKEKVQVPTMSVLQELGFAFNAPLKCHVLELPYGGEELSMYVMLPDKKEGIIRLVESLTSENLTTAMKQLSFLKTEVKLPKLKLNLQLPLSTLLMKLGIKDLFNNPDLSGLAPNVPAVHDIRHGAVIEVNEEGTEAAGATAVLLERSMPAEFNANHPYIFFISHKPTDMILFAGAIFRP